MERLTLTIVFWAAVALYARYVFRRLGPVGAAAPWPRGKRLVLFLVMIVVTVVVLVPAVVMMVGHLMSIDGCSAGRPLDPGWRCSVAGQWLLLATMLLILLPLAALWLRVLVGITNGPVAK